MVHQHVSMEREDEVAVITLDNPGRRNALSRGMQEGLLALMKQVRDTPSIRCVVLTGAGEAFCAGADLAGGIPQGDGGSRGQVMAEGMEDLANPLILAMRTLPVPVVTALNGVAAGAGVGIALCADIVVAARSSYFYLPFMPKLGIVPDLGSTWFLERSLGRARATALTLLGTKLPAQTAEQWGLVWACADDACLRDEAMKIARQLASLPACAAHETRAAFDAASQNGLDAQLQYETDRQRELFDRPEFAEGVRAFLEKRDPTFVRPS